MWGLGGEGGSEGDKNSGSPNGAVSLDYPQTDRRVEGRSEVMKEYKIWLAKILTVIVLTFVIVPFVAGGVLAASSMGGPKVSVVELSGVIEDASDVLKSLYSASRDKDIKAIVLRVDSPGGAVAPSEEIYHAVKKLKAEKPIVVSMGSVAASGGLYSSAGASRIFCQPGTQTGSIGVVMQIPNFTTIAKTVGVDMITVKSGALKDTGNQFRPMTDDERKFLEGTASKVHDAFIKAVSEGRNIPEEKVRSFADGRVLLGSEAKELGLVDDFGDIYDAGRAALTLAHVELKPEEVPNLVFTGKKKGFLAKAFDSASSIPAMIEDATRPSLKYIAY
jgi:protease IV